MWLLHAFLAGVGFSAGVLCSVFLVHYGMKIGSSAAKASDDWLRQSCEERNYIARHQAESLRKLAGRKEYGDD